MLKKLLYLPLVLIVFSVWSDNFYLESAVSINNDSILATNFPTPGYPKCKRCNRYHPGRPCPKDK